MPITKKYKPRFAKQLADGMRKDGLSIVECCAVWKITEATYYNWKKNYPKFAEACEIGERDFKMWWAARYREGATGQAPCNAAMMNRMATNVLGWTDKVEVTNKHEEQLHTIQIEMLPARVDRTLTIEHDAEDSQSITYQESN